MPGPISQIQMVYNEEQDRILFRVNSTDNQEFRFWLTRRYTAMLIRVLVQHLDQDPDISTQTSVEAKQAVREFKQEQALQGANFSKPFVDQGMNYPLGEDTLLAYRLTGKRIGDDLQLGIHPKQGQGISFVLNHELNTSIMELLKRCISKAQWGLQLHRSSGAGVSSTAIVN